MIMLNQILSARLFVTLAANVALALAAIILIVVGSVLLARLWHELSFGGALALYFVVWWTLLFAVLPLGVRSQIEAGHVTPGTDPGAPQAPALRQKALMTSFIAGLVLLLAGIPMRWIFG
jgi:predicted secreted protein